MIDPEELMRWRQRTDGRLATLERVTHEHTDKIDQYGRILVSIDEDVKDLKQESGAHKRLLQAVHDVQSDHTARLNRLEEDVSVLKTDVSVLKTDVSVLKTDVSVLKTDMAALKTDMAAVKSDVAETKVGIHTIIGLLTQEIGEKAG